MMVIRGPGVAGQLFFWRKACPFSGRAAIDVVAGWPRAIRVERDRDLRDSIFIPRRPADDRARTGRMQCGRAHVGLSI